jgi:putative ABC transport system permease protein
VPQAFTVRFAPGVDRAAALARLERDFPNTVVLPITPRNISNFERVRELPALLALLVALLGAGTIGHALVVSVRRNRRHVAVLKTLGFVRGQVSTLVACEATCVGLVALLGVPAGLALGRWVDRMLADAIGVEPHPVAPVAVVAAIALAAVVVVNLVAVVPGWRAGRLRPAEALRTE